MKISEFLKSMGNTADEVADYCRQNKITGEIQNPTFCPVIKAIYAKFPNLSKGLKVTTYRIPDGYRDFGCYGVIWMEGRYVTKVTWNDCQTLDPETPQAVIDFVRKFDAKQYPDLIGTTQKELKKQTLQSLSVEQKMALGL